MLVTVTLVAIVEVTVPLGGSYVKLKSMLAVEDDGIALADVLREIVVGMLEIEEVDSSEVVDEDVLEDVAVVEMIEDANELDIGAGLDVGADAVTVSKIVVGAAGL